MAEYYIRFMITANNLVCGKITASAFNRKVSRELLFSLILHTIGSIWQAIKRPLRQWTKPDNHSLTLNAALDMTRSKSELVLENALLRQQLTVLQRQVQRPKLSWRDRDLFRRIWRRKSKLEKKQGRPPLAESHRSDQTDGAPSVDG